MLSPFLVLRGFSKELCKFWILELAAMLNPFPVLWIFEKIWFDLAAMFEFKHSSRISIDYELAVMLSSSSSSYFFRGVVPLERTRVRSPSLMCLVILPDPLMWPYSRPGKRFNYLNHEPSSTCSKREDPPSWVKGTSVIKTGVFVGGPSGYAEKSLARMDILMPASDDQGLDHHLIDSRPVGLGIFKGDGSNWVKPFRLCGRFSADSS
ncbi:hypothetical protein AAC387_Pa07g2170 [Persea americana]